MGLIWEYNNSPFSIPNVGIIEQIPFMGFLNIIPIHGEFTVMSHSWDMLVPIESYLHATTGFHSHSLLHSFHIKGCLISIMFP